MRPKKYFEKKVFHIAGIIVVVVVVVAGRKEKKNLLQIRFDLKRKKQIKCEWDTFFVRPDTSTNQQLSIKEPITTE